MATPELNRQECTLFDLPLEINAAAPSDRIVMSPVVLAKLEARGITASPPTTSAPIEAQRLATQRRRPLTRVQARMFAWIASYINANGFAPTYSEIGKGLRLRSLATVHSTLSRIAAAGVITLRPRSRRSIALTGSCPYCGAHRRKGAVR